MKHFFPGYQLKNGKISISLTPRFEGHFLRKILQQND